jgi:hypothetical protein
VSTHDLLNLSPPRDTTKAFGPKPPLTELPKITLNRPARALTAERTTLCGLSSRLLIEGFEPIGIPEEDSIRNENHIVNR